MKALQIPLLAVSALLASCNYFDDAPTLTSHFPEDSETGVSLNAVVVMNFSEDISNASVTTDRLKLTNEATQAEIPGDIRVTDEVAVFVPQGRLSPLTSYRVWVSSLVQSTEGKRLPHDVTWTFTTRATGAEDDSIVYVEPSDFLAGEASVTLKAVAENERVTVIPVHASQSFSSNLGGTTGLDYTISTTGLSSTTARTALTKPAKNATPPRHSPKLKERWAMVNELDRARKRELNPVYAATEPFGKCVGPYSVGKSCAFVVIDAYDVDREIQTTLRRVSANAYWFVDQDDAGDFSEADLSRLEASFEQLAVPVDTRNFGDFPDSDSNGRIMIVLSHRLLDGSTRSGSLGYVAPWDFYPDGTFNGVTSNEGDIFYAATPAEVEALGYDRAEYFDEVMASTLVHELKHLIAVGTRLLNDRDVEELWLEEPSAVAAEELAGFGSPTGSTQAFASYALENPSAFSVWYDGRPSGREQNYSIYGFNFLFLWRIAERQGHSSFWRDWVAGPGNGISNLEAHAGESFESLMQDFALTLLLDHENHLSGYDYDSLDLRDGSWDNPALKPLTGSVSGSTRSMDFFAGMGQGQDARVTLRSSDLAPYFLIVRHRLH